MKNLASIVPASLLGAAVLVAGFALPAQAAGVAISISGDSSFGITAKATVTDQSVSKGTNVTGTTDLDYSAYALGIPLPVTGYYVNSFSTKFAQPVLLASDADLSSLTYKKVTDAQVGATQWAVNGSSDFWGTKSVTIKGRGKATTAGSGYFHAGTGAGHGTDANAILRTTVS
jgi:hypothetical protein